MRLVDIEAGGWRMQGVLMSESLLDRAFGLVGRPGRALLIDRRAIHGMGMASPLIAVGIDHNHRVIGHRILRPWRLLNWSDAERILELPSSVEPPPIGAKLLVEDG